MDGLVIAGRDGKRRVSSSSVILVCRRHGEALTHLRRRGNPLKDTAGVGGQHAATVGLGHDNERRARIAARESKTSSTGGGKV